MHILDVVKNGLCTGCGTCAGMCPHESLQMVVEPNLGIYLPQIDLRKCAGCGICEAVCPGHHVNFDKLETELSGNASSDLHLGKYQTCFLGHATNRETRFEASSGGIVSELVAYALEKGIVQGALLTTMNPDNPVEPMAIMARTRADVLSATGSKYCPVPLNASLDLVRKEKGDVAVVGLPCHIQGIRKAEQVDKKLKKRVVLHIGLFCGGVSTFRATKLLLKRTGIPPQEVADLRYRTRGWPGGMTIQTIKGETSIIPYIDYYRGDFTAHLHPRCTLCSDGTAELADIAMGDAWLPELRNDNLGFSAVICRTDRGMKILQEASSQGAIMIREIEKGKILVCQQKMLSFKKRVRSRMLLQRAFAKKVPLYTQPLLPIRTKDVFSGAAFYARNWLQRRRLSNPNVFKIYSMLRKVVRKSAASSLHS